MDLQRLRTFQVLSETLHLRHAAERLGITQSAVSQQVAALQKEFVDLDFRIANSSRIEAMAVANEFDLGVCGFRPTHEELFEVELGEDHIIIAVASPSASEPVSNPASCSSRSACALYRA